MEALDPDAARIISYVADSTSARYRTFVERDDLYAEVLTYYLENAKRFEKWRSSGENNDTIRLMRGLFEAARKYCETEKATKSGYSFDDVAWYTPDQLIKLLPLALNPGWDGLSGLSEDHGMPQGKSPASENGNLLAMVVDIRRALRGSKLTLADYDNPEHLKALSVKLGGSFPTASGYHVGSRRVMSNAAAAIVTRVQETE